MNKLPKSEKKSFLLHSMQCLDLLLDATINCNELTLNEKVKFGDIISGAHSACYKELNGTYPPVEMKSVSQTANEFDVFGTLGKCINPNQDKNEK